MQYLELTLPGIAENLALDEALLEGAQAGDPSEETLRIWRADTPFIVLGRSSRVDDEVHRSLALTESIPIFRRVSGGATVVAGPGCMFYGLVLSLERRPHLRMLDTAHQFVMDQLRRALLTLEDQIELDGTCDLIVRGKKVSGNSVRMIRDWMLYHGTLLLDMDLSTVERLLKHPPREPQYRAGRSHHEFLDNLRLPYPAVAKALREQWQANTAHNLNLPRQRMDSLVRDKYQQDAWNLSR